MEGSYKQISGGCDSQLERANPPFAAARPRSCAVANDFCLLPFLVPHPTAYMCGWPLMWPLCALFAPKIDSSLIMRGGRAWLLMPRARNRGKASFFTTAAPHTRCYVERVCFWFLTSITSVAAFAEINEHSPSCNCDFTLFASCGKI
jgi:hypothetical protein